MTLSVAPASAIRISVVIKAKDEQLRLPAALASCTGFADEVIVVDDDSRDDTAAIAKAAGAVVITHPSRDGDINELDLVGFLAASGTHICRLDADERMQPTLAARLRELAAHSDVAGVRFARKNVMFGDWPRHGGWHVADQLRFFRSDAWDRGWHYQDIHGQVPVAGTVVTLPAEPALSTLHEDYDSVLQFVQRSYVKYAAVEARDRLASGRRSTPRSLLWCPVKRTAGRIVLRRGYRDGYRGLLLAMLLGGYEMLVEAYMWDAQRTSEPDPASGPKPENRLPGNA